MSGDLSFLSWVQTVAHATGDLIGRDSWLVTSAGPVYERALHWLSRRRGIAWNFNGETFRVDARYRWHLGQRYEVAVAELLRTRVRPGELCLDVGANVGAYVLQLARWSHPGGTVVAFEPNPAALEILMEHVRMNDLQRNVTVVPAAVGATAGTATLYADRADGMSRLGAASPAIAGRAVELSVPVMTLDAYCASHGLSPDWLLIDIEGFEIAALAGARRTIERRGRDLRIVVEMHPDGWDTAGTSVAEAEGLVKDLDLRAISLDGQADPFGEHGAVELIREM